MSFPELQLSEWADRYLRNLKPKWKSLTGRSPRACCFTKAAKRTKETNVLSLQLGRGPSQWSDQLSSHRWPGHLKIFTGRVATRWRLSKQPSYLESKRRHVQPLTGGPKCLSPSTVLSKVLFHSFFIIFRHGPWNRWSLEESNSLWKKIRETWICITWQSALFSSWQLGKHRCSESHCRRRRSSSEDVPHRSQGLGSMWSDWQAIPGYVKSSFPNSPLWVLPGSILGEFVVNTFSLMKILHDFFFFFFNNLWITRSIT